MLILDVQLARTEFECSSDISYKWKRGTEELPIYVEAVFQKSANEESAKQALGILAKTKEGKALKLCLDLHENMAGCLAGRTNVYAQALSNSNYAARKEIQKAIQEDCKRQTGECRGVVRGEAVCKEIAVAVANDTGDKKPVDKKKAKGK